MSSVSVHCGGKRYVAKVTPMQKLQTVVEQVASQINPRPDLSACSLLINGKQADLSLQYRFASLGPLSKLELQTGQPHRLGVKEQQPQSLDESAKLAQQAPSTLHGVSEHAGPSQRATPAQPVQSEAIQPQVGSPQVAAILPQDLSRSTMDGTESSGQQKLRPISNHERETLQAPSSSAAAPGSQGGARLLPDFGRHLSDGAGPSKTQSAPEYTAALHSQLTPQFNPTQEVARDPGEEGSRAELPVDALPVWSRQLGLDRDVRIFTLTDLEASRADEAVEEPPDDFYEFGVEDYARVMQGLQKKKQHAERGLRTHKLREQEEKAQAARYPHTLVRIIFPSGDIVQMQFSSQDLVGTLSQALRKCLMPGVANSNWYLYTAPPKQVLKDTASTLYKAGLCPAAKIYFGTELLYKEFLRPELQEAKGPVPQPAKAEEEQETAQQHRALPSSSSGFVEKRISEDKPPGSEKKLPRWMKMKR